VDVLMDMLTTSDDGSTSASGPNRGQVEYLVALIVMAAGDFNAQPSTFKR
jgi:hypothetical protein